MMKRMKALQWNGFDLRLADVPRPRRQENECLLKVVQTGVCNTDLEILRGYHQFHGTLGHEFIALVEESDDESLIGQAVVCDINCACGACPTCRSGHPHHCPQRVTIGINGKDGAFAEFISVPRRNLVPLPATLSHDRAVFAEPVAAALEILEQVTCTQGGEAAVVGDGKLGLLITMCLAINGMDVTLIGHHPEKLFLLDGFPVRFFDTAPGKLYPLVVEASGNHGGFDTALSLTAPRGTLVLKSTYADGFFFNPAAVIVNEITLLGSRCGPMQKAVALLDSGKIKPERLIEKRYPLADSAAAVEHAKQKGVLKVIIDMATE